MFQYSGKCYCAAVVIEFSSPLEISRYRSRLCDCDYCMQRGIEYLSDPKGQISFISKLSLYNEKQGSEQARFLLCRKCQMVVGVCYMDENTCVGNLNSRLLEQFNNLQGSITVSPKKLSKTEKIGRWSGSWSQVQIIIG